MTTLPSTPPRSGTSARNSLQPLDKKKELIQLISAAAMGFTSMALFLEYMENFFLDYINKNIHDFTQQIFSTLGVFATESVAILMIASGTYLICEKIMGALLQACQQRQPLEERKSLLQNNLNTTSCRIQTLKILAAGFVGTLIGVGIRALFLYALSSDKFSTAEKIGVAAAQSILSIIGAALIGYSFRCCQKSDMEGTQHTPGRSGRASIKHLH